MKSLKHLSCLALTILSLLPSAARASVPNIGVGSNPTSIPERAQAKDGNGVAFMEDHFLGYKVFVATASVPILVSDDMGNAAINGLVHQVCISSSSVATDYVVLYDTITSAGYGTMAGGGTTTTAAAAANVANFTNANVATDTYFQITPEVQGLTTAEHCLVMDVQFTNGLVVLENRAGTTALPNAHVYWRPGKGGRN